MPSEKGCVHPGGSGAPYTPSPEEVRHITPDSPFRYPFGPCLKPARYLRRRHTYRGWLQNRHHTPESRSRGFLSFQLPDMTSAKEPPERHGGAGTQRAPECLRREMKQIVFVGHLCRDNRYTKPVERSGQLQETFGGAPVKRRWIQSHPSSAGPFQ